MKKIIYFLLLAAGVFSCTPYNDYNSVKVNVYSRFSELPLNSVKPEGWLKNYLVNQRNGLTGHLEVAGFPFDSSGWGSKSKDTTSWWPYEQTAYWIDGMIRCGYLLDDTFLINKALGKIHRALANVDSLGYIGPSFMKTDNMNNHWPLVVFFRALMAQYSATGDPQVLKAIMTHYHNLKFDLCSEREQVNIENMLWFYSRTGDTSLLCLAKKVYACYNEGKCKDELLAKNCLLKGEKLDVHGVSFNEVAKLGAIMYMYTGDTNYLRVAESAYRIVDKYYMMVDGVHVSSENFHYPPDALMSHETCVISDYTWSLGYMLMATGDASYADKIEKAMFNASPGCVFKDFKALQYFSCPNQVLATNTSNHNHYWKGNKTMRFAPTPWPNIPCCPGNVNRAMPDFACRLWMTTSQGNIVAAMYAPCELHCSVNKEEISIKEKTDYPFDNKIRFIFNTGLKEPFIFRIPSWCANPGIQINGKNENIELKPGTYVQLNRQIKKGDTITLMLPQDIRISRWPDNGIAVERGPLVYSLNIKGSWTQVEEEKYSTKDFPAWNGIPESPWNYAMCMDKPESFIFKAAGTISGNPWENPPYEIKATAKLIKGWKIIYQDTVMNQRWSKVVENGVITHKLFDNILYTGKFAFTPKLPDITYLKKNAEEKIDTISLVPYGCTRLRITIFPDLEALKGQ